MARFHGAVGYGETVEDPPDSGKWVLQITERSYLGDVVRNISQVESGMGLNDDIRVSNQVSIVADSFVIEHFTKIKYVMWMGVAWTVTDVEVRPPRLILSLGKVWNGPKA